MESTREIYCQYINHIVNVFPKWDAVITSKMNEETRKIQFSGKSSYMIALPKKWVEEMGLRPGSQVMVTRQDNASLLISLKGTGVVRDKGEVTIELSPQDNGGAISRKLVALYLVGYNVIHIKGEGGKLTSTQRDVVKETVHRHLIGTEVVADSTEGITLQVLLGYPELSVENALRRMFLITASMHKDAIIAFRKLDKDSIEGVIKTDDEVDRFGLYLIRQLKMAVQNDRILKEIGLTTPRDCLGYRLIVKSVERVADHANKIAQEALMISKPFDEMMLAKITQLSEFALSLFEESGVTLFKRDYDAADRIVEKAQLIGKMQQDFLTSIEKGKAIALPPALRLIVEDIRRTAEYSSDIAEIVLNLTVEQVVSDKK